MCEWREAAGNGSDRDALASPRKVMELLAFNRESCGFFPTQKKPPVAYSVVLKRSNSNLFVFTLSKRPLCLPSSPYKLLWGTFFVYALIRARFSSASATCFFQAGNIGNQIQ